MIIIKFNYCRLDSEQGRREQRDYSLIVSYCTACYFREPAYDKLTDVMSQLRNKVNLDKTLAFTKSSYAIKDPYLIGGNILYSMLNRVKSFMAVRMIENEFVDFKPHLLRDQFIEINSAVHSAFVKKDRVNMQRSLSEPMLNYALQLRNSKRNNPFLKEVTALEVLQSRIYSESDQLLPEEQWAQITVRMTGKLLDKGTGQSGQDNTV